MKRALTIILCMALILTFSGGCRRNRKEGDSSADHQTVAAGDKGKITEEADNTAVTEEPEYRFTFRPKAVSGYWKEIFGETKVQTWYNLVDAALEGKETFECPDQDTYDWVIGQFPEKCFPVLGELVENSYEPVENGVARLHYKTSREEFDKKLSEFESQVEGILNETMKEDYTDLEKALSLYRYFCTTYEYDYETYNNMMDEYQEQVRCYRLFSEGKGVCQEISTAYSYLLTQVGVDATIMMGGDHAWSYVRINGNNYHIDPTFGLSDWVDLGFFMMTDEQRKKTYSEAEEYIIASAYTQEYDCGEYTADDDTFSPIWDCTLEDFDHGKHMIRCYKYDDNGNQVNMDFNYEGF